MTDKIVYLTTRHTTVRRKSGGDDKPPRRGMIDVFEADGMTGIDGAVPASVAAKMLLIAEKAGVKIR